jgi:hypothetical protein
LPPIDQIIVARPISKEDSSLVAIAPGKADS